MSCAAAAWPCSDLETGGGCAVLPQGTCGGSLPVLTTISETHVKQSCKSCHQAQLRQEMPTMHSLATGPLGAEVLVCPGEPPAD